MFNPRRHISERTARSGFTLVEAAVVLLIFGMIVLAITYALRLYYLNYRQSLTLERMNIVQAALTEFVANTGRYPCPAPAGAAPGSAGYMVEDCSLAPTPGRDADGDTINDDVLIGAVPVNTLLPFMFYTPLRGVHAFDAWDNRFTYAVSQRLSDAATYNDAFGAIYVKDEHNTPVVEPDGSAHAVLVSHGPNGRGARTRSGAMAGGCGLVVAAPPPPPAPPPLPATALSEVENCNGDATFMAGLQNLRDNSYNDDIVKFLNTRASSLWRYVTQTTITNNNPGNVGIGAMQTPTSRLHTDQRIKANKMRADRVCDTAKTACLETSALAKDEDRMQCDGANEAVTQIELNGVVKATCEQVFTGRPVSVDCPPGEVAYGISTKTGVLCQVMP